MVQEEGIWGFGLRGGGPIQRSPEGIARGKLVRRKKLRDCKRIARGISSKRTISHL